MNNLPNTLLQEFTGMHDEMTRLETSAGPDTDLQALEASVHESYRGTITIAGPGMEQPQAFGRQEALDGMREMITSGHTSRQENRLIRMRSATEAVVFFEHVLVKDGQDVNRIFLVQTWLKVDDTWKVMRETMEQVAV